MINSGDSKETLKWSRQEMLEAQAREGAEEVVAEGHL